MDTNQIGSLAAFAAAAALAVQGFNAQRDQTAMQTVWPVLEGVVTHARPDVFTDSDGTYWFLYLSAQTPDGIVDVRLIANSQSEHEAQIASHPRGSALRIRRDPKSGALFVEGHTPKLGAGWLYATAIGLVAIGIASWFDIFRLAAPATTG